MVEEKLQNTVVVLLSMTVNAAGYIYIKKNCSGIRFMVETREKTIRRTLFHVN